MTFEGLSLSLPSRSSKDDIRRPIPIFFPHFSKRWLTPFARVLDRLQRRGTLRSFARRERLRLLADQVVRPVRTPWLRNIVIKSDRGIFHNYFIT
jgi:hypothetical protein